ncbi:class I SAM-dependent methyltransferase [Rubrobacter taiwanensis]|jgi:ubiquinone/menaquinone biosynthesis C-methylase UbiE|uniref:Class I SAM-dependent methyltransferase n=1 Tax=Rubrobacter taiwanensis TaxID=185139 RepID=A0A4R1BG66_9ACTN|nr:class I SAM-dependent methyltransferase [Rubrobacter taiwanensis]TCJ16181.1 class I SAM-dependent methyltransferase [Rubrobacter taiwanensis]
MYGRLYDAALAVPERAGLRELRREVLAGLRGRVLELGVGTGLNFPLYPPELDELVGVDPDESMLGRARERARGAPFPVRLVVAAAEDLPFEAGSFDAAAATLAMCTVPAPERALREARRVLRPGGELRLLEHVRADRIGRLQELATPVWKRVAGGCHLDRETLKYVREAGFEVERVERRLGGVLLSVFARS